MATSLPDLNQLALAVDEAARAAQSNPRRRNALLETLLGFSDALLEQLELEDAANASAEAMRIAAELIDEGQRELGVKLGVAMRQHADALLELGRGEHALDAYVSAIRVLAELAQTSTAAQPELAGTLLHYGNALRRCGRAEQALRVLDQALSSFGGLPSVTQMQLARAKALAELGRADEAIAAFHELGSDSPEAIDGLDALASSLYSLGRTDEAIEPAERAVELITRLARQDPIRYLHSLARLTGNLARHYQQAQRFDRAAALYEQAVDGLRILAHTRPHVHGVPLIQLMCSHALALAQSGELERAHAVARTAVELAEREPGWGLVLLIAGTRQFLADLAVDLGRSDEAIEQLVAGMRRLGKAIPQDVLGARETAMRLGEGLRELCESQGLAMPDDVAAMLSSCS